MNAIAAIVKRMLAVAAGVAWLLALFPPLTFGATAQRVSLVVSDDAGKPVQHGLSTLRRALQGKAALVEPTASLQKAVSYRLFEQTEDPQRLDDAIASVRRAIEAWRLLVAAAGDFYTDDLMMGVRGANLCGHWQGELAALEKGLRTLERQRSDAKPQSAAKAAPRYRPETIPGGEEAPAVTHRPVTTTSVGKPLAITAEVRDPSGVKWVRLRYRSVKPAESCNV